MGSNIHWSDAMIRQRFRPNVIDVRTQLCY
nr:MAG TPA: hypothetical protein [Caudoviricetes sp.]